MTMNQDASDLATTAGGEITIVDPVLAKIAGIAARRVDGVHALGGGAERVLGNVREAVGSRDLGQGVRVTVEDDAVTASVTIVVDYPAPLHEVAAEVRAAVTSAIDELAGMRVEAVNVSVGDIHVPGADDEPESEPELAGEATLEPAATGVVATP